MNEKWALLLDKNVENVCIPNITEKTLHLALEIGYKRLIDRLYISCQIYTLINSSSIGNKLIGINLNIIHLTAYF